LLQGDYRLEKPAFGIVFYASPAIRGTYPQIRQFVGATLKAHADRIARHAAVRAQESGAITQLEAQVRMTVYFRPANEGETP